MKNLNQTIIITKNTTEFEINIDFIASAPTQAPNYNIKNPSVTFKSYTPVKNIGTFVFSVNGVDSQLNTITISSASEEVFSYVVREKFPKPISYDTKLTLDENKYSVYNENGYLFSSITYDKTIFTNRIIEPYIDLKFDNFKLNGESNIGGVSVIIIPEKSYYEFFSYDFSFPTFVSDDRKVRNIFMNHWFSIYDFINISFIDDDPTKYGITFVSNTGSEQTFNPQNGSLSYINVFSKQVPQNTKEVKITYNGETQTLKLRKCENQYTLFYTNILGGIDIFDITTNVIVTSNFEREYYKQYDVRKDYLNAIKKSYSFSSNWLSDDESEYIVNNLFTSNNLMLFNKENGEKIPVNLVTSSVEHKKFANGRNLVQYTIELNSSKNINIR